MRLNQLERPILASDVGLLTILQEIVIKKQWHRLRVIGRIFKMALHQMPSHLKKNINALNAEKWVILHLNVPLIKNDKIIKELYYFKNVCNYYIIQKNKNLCSTNKCI